MNTSQRRRKHAKDSAQLSAAAIAAAASRKSTNRSSSRLSNLKGAIARTSLPVLVNVRSSFSEKLAESCRFNRKSDSDEEATVRSSTTGDEVPSNQTSKKAWDSISTLGLQGPDISAKSITCSAKSLAGAASRNPTVPNIDELQPSTSPKSHHPVTDQEDSVNLVPETLLQTKRLSNINQVKLDKRSRTSKRAFLERDHSRKPRSTKSSTRSSSSATAEVEILKAEAEIMKMEIQELKTMLKEKTQTIVKLEVDLELANDIIEELKEEVLDHTKKKNSNTAVGRRRVSLKQSGTRSSRSAMDLYRTRISKVEG